MPRSIRTPEDILRETNRDLYFVQFTDGDKAQRAGREPDGKPELLAWLATHMPHVNVEVIAPSEFSGYLQGGFTGDLALHWLDDDVTTYAAAWEDADCCTTDPRWQVIWYSQDIFAKRISENSDPRTWPI